MTYKHSADLDRITTTMDSKEDSFSIADLETAVSMASIADDSYPSQVFTGCEALEVERGYSSNKGDTASTTSLLGSDSSMGESASSFQYTSPSLPGKSFSSVALKLDDPMWQPCLTPEPSLSPQPKHDPEFINDLLSLVDEIPSATASIDSPSSLPFHPVANIRQQIPVRAKSSSKISLEPFHFFPFGKSHSHSQDEHSKTGDSKMDCATDGQKMSSPSGEKSHRYFWSHRTKHHSADEKKTDHTHSVGQGSHHLFHDLGHYIRRISHIGSHEKEVGIEPPRKHNRVHRASSSEDSEKPAPLPMRDRSHSTGAKPKKRTENCDVNSIQTVYSIYDKIVKEGKINDNVVIITLQCARLLHHFKLKRTPVGGWAIFMSAFHFRDCEIDSLRSQLAVEESPLCSGSKSSWISMARTY